MRICLRLGGAGRGWAPCPSSPRPSVVGPFPIGAPQAPPDSRALASLCARWLLRHPSISLVLVRGYVDTPYMSKTKPQTTSLSVPAFAALLPALSASERAALAGTWVGPLTDRGARYSVRRED